LKPSEYFLSIFTETLARIRNFSIVLLTRLFINNALLGKSPLESRAPRTTTITTPIINNQVITTPSLATITLASPSVSLANNTNNTIISNIMNITNNTSSNNNNNNQGNNSGNSGTSAGTGGGNNTGNVLRTLGNSFVSNTATLANIQSATLNNHVFGYGLFLFLFWFCFHVFSSHLTSKFLVFDFVFRLNKKKSILSPSTSSLAQ
jgi:hypothetical protein